jgi:FlaA1/EpsC-like NDP-sugar epimerase
LWTNAWNSIIKFYRSCDYGLGKSKEFPKSIKNLQIEDLLERKAIVLDKSISKQLKDKTIVITGAAGSSGSQK